jgi:hypothetical protein
MYPYLNLAKREEKEKEDYLMVAFSIMNGSDFKR